jgi:F-type H+-transporting ATPase subunit a
MNHVLAAEEAQIEPGHHITATIGGLVFNIDTIWSTAIAGLIVIGLGFFVRSRVTSDVPSKIQLVWEVVVGWVERQVEDNIGKVAPYVVPLAVTLFFFILIANWIELVPTNEIAPSPTADVNLTFAMGLLVFVWATVAGIRRRGGINYGKHFFQPHWIMFPINLIEEIMKPVTLALRLFGNIFAGGIMIALIGLLPVYIVPFGNVAWKLFDMFIGVIQAFIFALLTILYFGMATRQEEH